MQPKFWTGEVNGSFRVHFCEFSQSQQSGDVTDLTKIVIDVKVYTSDLPCLKLMASSVCLLLVYKSNVTKMWVRVVYYESEGEEGQLIP